MPRWCWSRKAASPPTTFFLSPIDPRTAFYYGRRPDSASVEGTLGVKAHAFAALAAFVDSIATANPKTTVYTLADFGDADFAHQDSLTRGQSFVKTLTAKHPSLTVKDAHAIVDQLRANKSSAELALLRKAGEISAEGHRAAMIAPEPSHEYELQAVVEYTFTRLGGERPAYGSIVGAGANGTQLHYMKDRNPAKPGDFVVIDAATQYEGYAADVTRTIPVSGSYTARPTQDLPDRPRRAGRGRAQLEAGDVGGSRVGFVDRRPRERARRVRPGRERDGDVRSAVAGELYRRAYRLHADVLLDDPRPGSRHRPRRPRSGAVLLWRQEVQGRRRLHDRAGHLRQPGDARRARPTRRRTARSRRR